MGKKNEGNQEKDRRIEGTIENAGYKSLCNAIIIQAINDYIKARRYQDEIEMKNIENFFRSDWFQLLTDIEGEYIIELLSQENVTLRRLYF